MKTGLSIVLNIALIGLNTAQAQPCTAPPAQPRNVQFIPPEFCYPRVTWDALPGSDFYVVYRSLTCNAANAVIVGTTRGLRFDDVSFPANLDGQYGCYFIRGVNPCGMGAAGFTDRIRFKLHAELSGVSTSTDCHSVTVHWTAPPASPDSGISFSVQRVPYPYGRAVVLATGITGNSFVDMNPPREMFTYQVAMRVLSCDGAWTVSRPTAADPLTPPYLSYIESYYGCGTVTLSWVGSPCSTSYSVLRSVDTFPESWVEVGRTSQFWFDDHVVDRSVRYLYQIVAHAPQGDSEPSNGEWASVVSRPPQLIPNNPNQTFPACSDGGVTLYVPLSTESQHDLLTIDWLKNDDPLVDNSRVFGVHSLQLLIRPADPGDTGVYTVRVTNACGTTVSDPFNVFYDTCSICPPCMGDYNQDGGQDGLDVAAFIADWEAGGYCTDYNQDGGVDGTDLAGFIADWYRLDC